jgi:hypothetical protein
MTFLYDKHRRAAVDPSAGVSVRGVVRFYDDAFVFAFEYSKPEVTFEFDAAIQRERRSYCYRGKPFDRVMVVAYHVIEPSIRAGYAQAWKKAHPDNPRGAILDDAAYQNLKKSIEEGMAVYGTAGGKTATPVPDFHVGFVKGPSEVKHLLFIP